MMMHNNTFQNRKDRDDDEVSNTKDLSLSHCLLRMSQHHESITLYRELQIMLLTASLKPLRFLIPGDMISTQLAELHFGPLFVQ
jgi:hypothetical protein